jgi:hypothetical protein
MSDKVECRSDSAYIGYPVAFYWQDMRLEVDKVVSENRSPQGFTFQVRNDDHGIFILNYDINTDQWSVKQL